jgi:hypothetical protein
LGGREAVSPTELEARAAAALRYQPADPNAPMIGIPDLEIDSPIFDSISVWFSTDPRPEPPAVIDLRDDAQAGTRSSDDAATRHGPAGNRWAALGDQQWLATNARAAAGPSVAGNTEAGLPRRAPGANLLPTAAEAAPTIHNVAGRAGRGAATVASSGSPTTETSGGGPGAEAVRGRLGSYQRGLTSARRVRQLPDTGDATSARPTLGGPDTRQQDSGQEPADRGGDQ